MSRRLVMRMWLYRMGRTYERWLKLATGVGFGGLALTVLLYEVAPGLGQDWQMILMGFCLVLTGVGHALLGEGVTLEQYATGESEEMPAVTKLASGLLASGGGVLIAVIGLSQVMA
ncbi:MAG: hypothetical protein ACOY93_23445 [Bacillota bacterium]